MINYNIKLYNEYLEKMCDLIARELKFDNITTQTLKSGIYTNRWIIKEKLIAENISGDERYVLSSWGNSLDAILENLGLVEKGYLKIPTYDELQKIKEKKEELDRKIEEQNREAEERMRQREMAKENSHE